MERRPYRGGQTELLRKYGLNEEFEQILEVIEYEKGEYICQQEQEIHYVLLVLEGEARVFCDLENGKRLLVCFYEAGGVIGDVEFMMGTVITDSSVQVMTRFRCIGIPVPQSREKLMKNQIFLYQLGNNLAHKILRSTRNSANNILYPLETRLCSYIDTACREDVFDEKLTEVAEALGTSYRHLLRALNELIEQNILQKNRHKYVIIDRSELKKRSKDFYKPVEGRL